MEVRQFGALLVPSVLQTDAYARAVFRAYHPNFAAEDIDQRVVNRTERSCILDNPVAPVMWTLLDEAVLRRKVGSGHVMAEQLCRIRARRGPPRPAHESAPSVRFAFCKKQEVLTEAVRRLKGAPAQ